MGRITVLPREVADQIAAGEVVERPASVVKELVENALDAGAMSITVELEDGGRTLVRVSDDGVGMDREDALLALDRHATSKIRSARDLVGVPTYGFRGEALPAIASVAELQLETAPAADRAQANLGTSLVVKGGRVERVESSARAPGTTVTVRRLFFNTPARRKFLRSQRSETRAAVETLTVLALARLDVSFTLVSDGRSRLEAPRVAGFGDRVASLFGRRTAEELIPVEHHLAGVSVRGFVQRPAEAKAAGRKAHLFVNGRPFRDPFLVRAAEAGYRATIAPGLRPTLLLSLGVPGDGVDVNVHPAKLEVRFRDRMLVERAVEEAVRSSLRPMEAAAVVGHPPYADDARPAAGSSNGHQSVPIALFDSDIPAGERKLGHAVGQDILQIFDTYLVFETLEGMVFVDQHSAHERVLYERAMAQLRGEGSAAQRLLLPLTVDLSPEELEAVEDHANLLSAVGYEIEPFGGRSVVVHAVPNPHPRFDARRCVEELTADLARGRFGGFANRLERFAATFACRAAIKAGHTLDRQERRELLRRLFACELPPHDVHGRPTIVQLPKDELERRFGRS
jgi:DNA mismatch repair protein MutL